MSSKNSGLGEPSIDLTVLILSRDHEAFIDDCLDSVFREFGSDVPVVLVDVGSVDDTFQAARRSGTRLFSQITTLRVRRSMNSIASIKVGLEFVTSGYGLLISADDALDIGYSKSIFDILANARGPVVISSKLKVTNQALKCTSTRQPKWTSRPAEDQFNLLASNPGTAPGSIVPVSILAEQPLWINAPEIIAEDLIIWWSLIGKVKFISNLNGAVLYRQHSGNVSRRKNSAKYAYTLGVALKLSYAKASTKREYIQVAKLLIRSLRHLHPSKSGSFLLGLSYRVHL